MSDGIDIANADIVNVTVGYIPNNDISINTHSFKVLLFKNCK